MVELSLLSSPPAVRLDIERFTAAKRDTCVRGMPKMKDLFENSARQGENKRQSKVATSKIGNKRLAMKSNLSVRSHMHNLLWAFFFFCNHQEEGNHNYLQDSQSLEGIKFKCRGSNTAICKKKVKGNVSSWALKSPLFKVSPLLRQKLNPNRMAPEPTFWPYSTSGTRLATMNKCTLNGWVTGL